MINDQGSSSPELAPFQLEESEVGDHIMTEVEPVIAFLAWGLRSPKP